MTWGYIGSLVECIRLHVTPTVAALFRWSSERRRFTPTWKVIRHSLWCNSVEFVSLMTVRRSRSWLRLGVSPLGFWICDYCTIHRCLHLCLSITVVKFLSYALVDLNELDKFLIELRKYKRSDATNPIRKFMLHLQSSVSAQARPPHGSAIKASPSTLLSVSEWPLHSLSQRLAPSCGFRGFSRVRSVLP